MAWKSATPAPNWMKVMRRMEYGSHMTSKVMMKNVIFLPLLSCEYVYARARTRAFWLLSLGFLLGKRRGVGKGNVPGAKDMPPRMPPAEI